MTLAERLTLLRDATGNRSALDEARFADDLHAALSAAIDWIAQGCYTEPIEFSEAHGNLVALADQFAREVASGGDARAETRSRVDAILSMAEGLNQHYVLVEDVRPAIDRLWVTVVSGRDPFRRMAALRRVREILPQDRSLHDAVQDLELVMAEWWLDDARTASERAAARSALSGYKPVTSVLDSAFKNRARTERREALESTASRVLDAIAAADQADDEDAVPLIDSALSLLEGALVDDALPDGRDWQAESSRLDARLRQIKTQQNEVAQADAVIRSVREAVESDMPLSGVQQRIATATSAGIELPPEVVATYHRRAANNRLRRRRLWKIVGGVAATVLIVGISTWAYLQWSAAQDQAAIRIAEEAERLLEEGRLEDAIEFIQKAERDSPSLTSGGRFAATATAARSRRQAIDRRREETCREVAAVANAVAANRTAPWDGSAELDRIRRSMEEAGGESSTELERCFTDALGAVRQAEARAAEDYRARLESVVTPARKAFEAILRDWPGDATGAAAASMRRQWEETAERLERQKVRLEDVLQSAPPIEALDADVTQARTLLRDFHTRLEQAESAINSLS